MQTAAYLVHGIGHQGLTMSCDNCSNVIDATYENPAYEADGKEFCDAACHAEYLEQQAYGVELDTLAAAGAEFIRGGTNDYEKALKDVAKRNGQTVLQTIENLRRHIGADANGYLIAS